MIATTRYLIHWTAVLGSVRFSTWVYEQFGGQSVSFSIGVFSAWSTTMSSTGPRPSKPARYHSPVYDRRDRLDAADLVFRTTEIIAVDHHQIGELAGLDGAPGLFSELKKCRPDGPHLEGFLPRDLLLRIDHLTFACPACNAGPHVEERIRSE